uniref:receptor protein-tyrosine kinase n=1 Tax=Aedes albopictus TaxID=7160 RepID=A0A1W7R6L9_AEDAL
MQVIILKYVQVLCITVFFSNNINCDKLLVHNEHEDQQLYRIASCAAQCLAEEASHKSLELCYKLCSEGKIEQPELVQNVEQNYNIQLICRDSNSLVIEIYPDQLPKQRKSDSSPHSSNGIHQYDPKASKHNRGNKDGAYSHPQRAKRSIARSDLSMQNRYENISGSRNENHQADVHYSAHNQDSDSDHIAPHAKPTHLVYLIKVQESGHELGDRTVYMSSASVVKIENLTPNKRYNITATVLTSDRQYVYVGERPQFRTLSDDYTPGNITKIDVIDFHTNYENSALLDALVTWQPAPDKTCHYEILYHASHSQDYHSKAVNVQKELYKHTITALELSSEYYLGIRAKNIQNSSRESELKWHTFHTPSCVDWHNSSVICAPESVSNVQVSTVYLSGDNYQFNITWDKPRFVPDYYIVRIYDLYLETDDDATNSLTRNVSGDANNLLIESLTIHGARYEVFISAYANNRTAHSSNINDAPIWRSPTDHWHGGRLAVIILTPVLAIGLMKIFISIICKRRAKAKRYEQRCEYFKELEQKAPVDPSTGFEIKVKNIQEILHPATFPSELIAPINDEMEINIDQIRLLDMVGEGAFGRVRKGILLHPVGTYTEVAVKMLKECPSLEDVKEFRREIEVMKSVGVHPNIVCIIGHYTKNVNEMMLLTEYCSEGNLLNYLRSEWNKVLRSRDRSALVAQQKLISVSLNDEDIFKECQSPSLECNKKPENVFNFDAPFIHDKKPFAYKNISDHSISEQPPLAPEMKITENRLYPLLNGSLNNNVGHCVEAELGDLKDNTKICTNSCKCNVEILQLDDGRDVETWAKGSPCSIKVSGCECDSLGNESGTNQKKAMCNLVDNQCYYKEDLCSEKRNQNEECIITSKQLLEFAKQIAIGMEFLARNKVVHRDLAARNVLVCYDKVVKISDFGLSRDIYQQNLYRKTGTGKLPIKWLALESLTHQVYTSQSDVWSYGILLYEICTLGGNPYPLLSTCDLIMELKRGYRMEKPDSCSKELYELMLSCWSALPIDRPTFTGVYNRMEELMKQNLKKDMINLDAIIDIQSTKTTSSEHSYLKPVEY